MVKHIICLAFFIVQKTIIFIIIFNKINKKYKKEGELILNILEKLTYFIYFMGVLLLLISLFTSRKENIKNISENSALAYVEKKQCVWDNKLNDLIYVIEIVYNDKTCKIKDKNIFDKVKEGSYIKIKLDNYGDFIYILDF